MLSLDTPLEETRGYKDLIAIGEKRGEERGKIEGQLEMLKQLIQAGSIQEDLVKEQIADLEKELAKITGS